MRLNVCLLDFSPLPSFSLSSLPLLSTSLFPPPLESPSHPTHPRSLFTIQHLLTTTQSLFNPTHPGHLFPLILNFFSTPHHPQSSFHPNPPQGSFPLLLPLLSTTTPSTPFQTPTTPGHSFTHLSTLPSSIPHIHASPFSQHHTSGTFINFTLLHPPSQQGPLFTNNPMVTSFTQLLKLNTFSPTPANLFTPNPRSPFPHLLTSSRSTHHQSLFKPPRSSFHYTSHTSLTHPHQVPFNTPTHPGSLFNYLHSPLIQTHTSFEERPLPCLHPPLLLLLLAYYDPLSLHSLPPYQTPPSLPSSLSSSYNSECHISSLLYSTRLLPPPARSYPQRLLPLLFRNSLFPYNTPPPPSSLPPLLLPSLLSSVPSPPTQPLVRPPSSNLLSFLTNTTTLAAASFFPPAPSSSSTFLSSQRPLPSLHTPSLLPSSISFLFLNTTTSPSSFFSPPPSLLHSSLPPSPSPTTQDLPPPHSLHFLLSPLSHRLPRPPSFPHLSPPSNPQGL
ncbi:hypothetical protein C7M84_021360 [Penaeus vannamei]|uniref:Uncharacterized protein n=1 Tax=Penaeus vannamei TaxID=6689 RepID=A0A423S9V3_PENVA|nr:hypothetical protein C7M84_021360 [Penaeus vannamei]